MLAEQKSWNERRLISGIVKMKLWVFITCSDIVKICIVMT